MVLQEDQIRYAAVTHVADIIARAKNIGSGGGADPELDRSVWDALHLSKQRIPIILEAIRKSLEKDGLRV
jgi:hypothetical protein